MNAVWNSYGQLCGCPEIFKKSCKFFCRELDIRVSQVMYTDLLYTSFGGERFDFSDERRFREHKYSVILLYLIQFGNVFLYFIVKELRNCHDALTSVCLWSKCYLFHIHNGKCLADVQLHRWKNIFWYECQEFSFSGNI